MIGVQELRKGVTIELDGQLFRVLEYQHHKPARGPAIIRTRLRNLRTGSTVDRSFGSGSKVQDIRLDHSKVRYMYSDGDLYYFMDTDTYGQPALSAEVLGEAVNYLAENLILDLETYEGEAITIDLPTTVDLEVVETDPGFAGDTATGVDIALAISWPLSAVSVWPRPIGAMYRLTLDGTSSLIVTSMA